MATKKLKIGLVQAKVSDKTDSNLSKTARFVSQAAGKGASLVCLQELFAMPYFCQKEKKEIFDLAEEMPGKFT